MFINIMKINKTHQTNIRNWHLRRAKNSHELGHDGITFIKQRSIRYGSVKRKEPKILTRYLQNGQEERTEGEGIWCSSADAS